MESIMNMSTSATPETSYASAAKLKPNMDTGAPMDLAQLVETLERELGRDPELAVKHKPKLQQLLE